ncbi:hypothetical protein [Agreia sp. COWG]|nr:hypothetical protein [Agreia sp. COWG]
MNLAVKKRRFPNGVAATIGHDLIIAHVLREGSGSVQDVISLIKK